MKSMTLVRVFSAVVGLVGVSLALVVLLDPQTLTFVVGEFPIEPAVAQSWAVRNLALAVPMLLGAWLGNVNYLLAAFSARVVNEGGDVLHSLLHGNTLGVLMVLPMLVLEIVVAYYLWGQRRKNADDLIGK